MERVIYHPQIIWRPWNMKRKSVLNYFRNNFPRVYYYGAYPRVTAYEIRLWGGAYIVELLRNNVHIRLNTPAQHTLIGYNSVSNSKELMEKIKRNIIQARELNI